MKTFEVRSRAEWRKWLGAHHDSESELWLVFQKRHTGRPTLAYEDAVDEALCFGWVDSLIKRLDDSRYARKFTPRKPDSKWSAINRKRYALLRSSGRLTAAGLARPPTNQRSEPARALPTRIPPFMARAFKDHPTAWANFRALAPSHRRRFIAWVSFAQQQETKTRRLREAIELVAKRQVLGLK